MQNQIFSMKEIDKLVTSWRHTDKFPCPECKKKLCAPKYECKSCNIKIKLKMRF